MTSTTNACWARCRSSRTAVRTSPCRPTVLCTSSCWTSRDAWSNRCAAARSSVRVRRLVVSVATRIVAGRFRRHRRPWPCIVRPDALEPWYGPERNFGYLAEVQPVFDKHCVRCHDYGQEAGQKLNLAGDLGLPFNHVLRRVAKEEVRAGSGRRPDPDAPAAQLGVVGQPPGRSDSARGTASRRLIRTSSWMRKSRDRVLTWIDINAPYYPEYASAYGDNRFGRSPLNDAQLGELRRLTGSEDVNFTRPAWSVCLQHFASASDPARLAVLGIIEEGQRMLSTRPRGRHAWVPAGFGAGDPSAGEVRCVAAGGTAGCARPSFVARRSTDGKSITANRVSACPALAGGR